MNVFIAIIEEAYISTRMKHKNSLIYTYLKLEPDFVEFKEQDDLSDQQVDPKKTSQKLTGSYFPDNHFLKYDKEQKRIKKAIYSKNTLREALSLDYEKILHKNPKEKSKGEIEDVLKELFENVSFAHE